MNENSNNKNSNRLRFLLGLTAAVLCLSILSGISSFILSAFYAMVAVMLAVTAITAIKTIAVAAKTAITGRLTTKEGEREVTAAGRLAAVGIMLAGIGVAGLVMSTVVGMGTIGIFAIPMLTALYYYKSEEIAINQSSAEAIKNDDAPTKHPIDGIRETSYQIVNSALTDVSDKLLYELGDSVVNFTTKMKNKRGQQFDLNHAASLD